MEWIILFIVSWIILLLVLHWKTAHINIWCGLLAVLLQTMVDIQGIHDGFYRIERGVVYMLGSSAFFVFGPVFVIGTLIAQCHPRKRMLAIINVIVLTGLYTTQELLIHKAGALVYIKWSIIKSLPINIGLMIILSWFSMTVLKKWKEVLR